MILVKIILQSFLNSNWSTSSQPEAHETSLAKRDAACTISGLTTSRPMLGRKKCDELKGQFFIFFDFLDLSKRTPTYPLEYPQKPPNPQMKGIPSTVGSGSGVCSRGMLFFLCTPSKFNIVSENGWSED